MKDKKMKNKKLNCKHAAMFGLDARIALAIFGALSVISGAALYSAIQNAKVTSMVRYFDEMSKSYQAFYLDTGEHTNGCALTTNNPSLPGWKGPYYWEKGASDCSLTAVPTPSLNINDPIRNMIALNSSNTGSVSTINGPFIKLKDSEWTSVAGDICPDDNNCSIFYSVKMPPIWINSTIFSDITAKIDLKIDGGDGGLKGSFRYGTLLPTLTGWHYKVMPS